MGGGGSERAKGVKKESVRNIPGRKERKKKSKSKKGSYSVTVPTRHLAVISVSHATGRIEK